MKASAIAAAIFAAAVIIIGLSSVYTVDETQQALVIQFGDVKSQEREPGLHFKLPFIQNVVYIDKRVLNLTSARQVGGEGGQVIITSDQKRLVVDAFARYRIVDALKFYQSVRDMRQASDKLQPIFLSNLRNVLGEATLEALVRDERAELMQRIEEKFNVAAQEFGVEVVDVRIRQADLPTENSEAIYRRMRTEREREAAEFRAQGQETAQRVRSRADRDVTVLLAEAQRDAERIRGEGDAERNRTFAQAFGQDPDFFAFYRSMQAYRDGLKGDSTTLILSPDSDFFRYFKDEDGQVSR
ncbi:HflC protein [Tepidicaulis marinus]|uniref:Protein HflC n=1 Tax=Tepidicaulis marinus TaxID=1333998 RepID=A0A081B9X1_9HYPH|nr:protease modulator HflC [Tepidicaulis marinus]GAK44839.1 HflC protein [Tepidicaulis marinus]